VEPEGGPAALVALVDGAPYAVSDACPHRGTALSGGLLRDGVVTCPGHLWQYDVRTGARHDTRGEGLACYPARLDGDDVVEAGDRPIGPEGALRRIVYRRFPPQPAEHLVMRPGPEPVRPARVQGLQRR
jgi:nitrite reductase/ring-hydroxylating ferredoxin subunit